MKPRKLIVLLCAALLFGGCSSTNSNSKKEVPQLKVESNILGLADTGNKSTLKAELIYTSGPGDINLYHYDETGKRVIYEDQKNISITPDPVQYSGSAVLDLGDVDDSLIDSSKAVVKLLDGNSYYADEFILNATSLNGEWKDGKYEYVLNEGDLLWTTWDYDTSADFNSGREWSMMGGDGNGVYNFRFEVSGILYDGEEVAPVVFPAAVYIYGRTCTDLSLSTVFVENSYDVSYTSGLTPSNNVQWKWHTDNEESVRDNKPYMNDGFTDYFSVVWPEEPSKKITAEDVTVALLSEFGDEYVLQVENAYGEKEYAVFNQGNETNIAVTYQQWALVPVYSTMKIDVNNNGETYSQTYDICSVAAYMVQTGGGGVTVDHTVTTYNYYGIQGMDLENAANTTYTLSTVVDGKTYFYAEDEAGNGKLVEGIEMPTPFGMVMVSAPENAWLGDGTEKYNIAVRKNVVFAETRLDKAEVKTVDGIEYTFTQNLSVSKEPSAIVRDGAYLQTGFNLNGVNVPKWAWTTRYQSGWTTYSAQPNSLPYVEGQYGYGYLPGSSNPAYDEELAAKPASGDIFGKK